MKLTTILLTLIPVLAVFYYIYNRKYRLRLVNPTPKLQKIVEKLDNVYRIPVRPNSIQPPKPKYERRHYTYPYDLNDTFYYEYVDCGKETKKLPVIVVCFMGGHSKSQVIRRMADQLSRQAHDVFILIPRGSMDTKYDPCQKHASRLFPSK